KRMAARSGLRASRVQGPPSTSRSRKPDIFASVKLSLKSAGSKRTYLLFSVRIDSDLRKGPFDTALIPSIFTECASHPIGETSPWHFKHCLTDCGSQAHTF